jgi:hypothetical protein
MGDPDSSLGTARGQIVVLREEIRRAGHAYRWFWIVGFGWMALDPLLLLLLCIVGRHTVPGWYVALACSWVVGLGALAVATFRFLRQARGRIRELWNPLTPKERAEAMRSLESRTRRMGPTKEVMLPFLVHRPGLAELSPAAAPDARGDEACPAEGER